MDVNSSVELIATKILVIRGKKVMLDRDLALLYGVSTGELNQSVKRHRNRFPEDFMFQMTKDEFSSLISQIVISKRGGRRKMPYLFTEQGIAMLSSVLNSERAIQVNVAIMRAFVKLREILLTHKELATKLEELEKKYQMHESDIQVIFETIKKLLEPAPVVEKPPIGFQPPGK